MTLTDAGLDMIMARPREGILPVVLLALCERDAIIAELRRLREDARELCEATKTARDAFRRYAAAHRGKMTNEGEAKARTNELLADLMDRALATKEKT